MFGHHVQCPVDAADRKWIEDSFVWLTERFGISMLSNAVVLPTSEYFPGPFSGEPEQLTALVNGIAVKMGMGQEPCVTVVPLAHSRGVVVQRGLTGCAGYPGGAFRGGEKGHVLALDQALAARPVATLATISHMLGHLRFVGQQGIPARHTTREHLIELHAVYTGFGVFGANAALEIEIDPSANMRAAASRGLSQGRATLHRCGQLTEEVHGYVSACFALMRGESRPKWSKHLDTNPRAYMRQSQRYLAQHPVERLLAIQSNTMAGAETLTPDVS